MKKTFLLLALCVMLLGGGLFAKTADISGTWIGKTLTPAGEDTITLELKKGKDQTYTGTLGDSLGLAVNADIFAVTCTDNSLTFSFNVFVDNTSQTIMVTMEIKGNTMTGSWDSGDGSKNSLELEKK